MGARIMPTDIANPDARSTGPSVVGLNPADWPRAARRVEEYLRAMGVGDPQEIERLLDQVHQRAEARAAAAPLEDPVEAAIEETHALLDRWLIAELGIEGDADRLCAARAAVLNGAIPGWSARWAGFAGESLAPAILAAHLPATPEPAPLTMEPNRIDLLFHRLGPRLLAAVCRVLCRSSLGGGSPGVRT